MFPHFNYIAISNNYKNVINEHRYVLKTGRTHLFQFMRLNNIKIEDLIFNKLWYGDNFNRKEVFRYKQFWIFFIQLYL